MDWITNPQAYAALATLVVLEIVLGIDNIIFISIISGRLPEQQQPLARRIGLLLAMFSRAALLFSINWLMGLEKEIFTIAEHGFSIHDIIMFAGGLFLMYKATIEISHSLYGEESHEEVSEGNASFFGILVQIVLLDLVFSLDSVITAVGMADDLAIMVIAVVIAIAMMMFAIDPISEFINRHPSLKLLGLAFLVLIGVSLLAEGFGHEIPKGYIYFAIGFSMFVETLDFRMRAPRKKGSYRNPIVVDVPSDN